MDMMKNKEDWKFDKEKASKALQELSRHVNPFRDENVADIEFKRFRLSIKKIYTLRDYVTFFIEDWRRKNGRNSDCCLELY